MAKKPSKTAESKEVTKRKSQRPFPAVPLQRALEISAKIKELNGGNPWPPDDVAAAIGASPRSSDFYYVTAASRDFGLTVGTRETASISLTELGREIAYAPNAEVEAARKRDAFLNVDLFKRVLDHYKGSNLPDMKYLGNTLQREFGLPEEHHADFARVFRENCEYLGIKEGATLSGKSELRPPTVTVGEPDRGSKQTAFVIMPFTERSPERPKGFFDEVLRSLITPAATEAGFQVTTANRQGSDLIQSTIINELLDADLVIADLTDHNPNVFFELGLRIAEDKPIALLKAVGTGRVFDIDNMLRVWEYKPQLWRSTIETDVPALKSHLLGAWETRAQTQSYMKILRRGGSDSAGGTA